VELLISVRTPGETRAAVAGGADIIDAKEPAHGALGPVSPEILRAIDARVPADRPLSVALGDAKSVAAVRASISALPLRRRSRTYIKIGMDGVVEASEIRALLTAAVEAAAAHPATPRVIAVVYADGRDRERLPLVIRSEAARVGVAGVLVDTIGKDGRTLLDWWPEGRLHDWVRAVRGDGLEAALAGSLGAAELERIPVFDPDVVGVRGAACAGGRCGSIEAARVRGLRRAVERGEAVIAANHQT
jgi:(5-formylfuran-3-yl)methyl phosphate synthase